MHTVTAPIGRALARILAALLLAAALLAQPVYAAGTAVSAGDGPAWQTKAAAVLILDRDSGGILYEYNADQRIYPASTTKLLTALCAAEATPDLDGDMVTVRQQVLDLLPDDDNSLAGLKDGDRLTMRQLLYCLLLSSGNDAALVIADHVGGDVDSFMRTMNERAAALGCTGSWFTNPHGLDGEALYSTARDMARIATAFMERPELAEIVRERTYTVDTPDRQWTLQSTNRLLHPESDLYDPATVGIKTGVTSLAGGCFISAAEQDGLRLLCVVMGVPALDANGYLMEVNPALREARDFQTWAFGRYVRLVLCRAGEPTAVTVARAGEVDAAPAEDVTAVVPAEMADALEEQTLLDEGLRAPLPAGAQVGRRVWAYQGQTVAQVALVLPEGARRSLRPYILALLVLLLALAAASLALLLRSRAARRRRMDAYRAAPFRPEQTARYMPDRSDEWEQDDRDDGEADPDNGEWENDGDWDNDWDGY